MTEKPSIWRMPAEWEPHQATWIAWPDLESDFPGKLLAAQWVYVEIVRCLMTCERVEIVCNTEETKALAEEQLERSNIKGNFRFHVLPLDRTWPRDSAPTAVVSADGKKAWTEWKFTAWEKFSNYAHDAKLPAFISELSKTPLTKVLRPDNGQPLIMEGGAIDTDGQGTLLTTEECLLSDIQERNHGMTREMYEAVFAKYLGIKKTIWLGNGCEGDTTHGHVDDIARFIAPGKVTLAVERDEKDVNCAPSLDNLERLQKATDANGKPLEIIELPYPHRIDCDGFRLPASYANFYIANGTVIVPTFNDPNDMVVLMTLQKHMPDRKVVGIHCVDLILGEGSLHCLTQQEPSS